VGFAILEKTDRGDEQAPFILRMKDRTTVDGCDADVGVIADVLGAITGDVEVECAVGVHVGEGERHGTRAWGDAGAGGDIGESAAAEVEVTEDAEGEG